MDDTAYYWIDTKSHGYVPPTAIDSDGQKIYVGKARLFGDSLPAKVIPAKHAAFVSYHGKEHVVKEFQILCEKKFDWVWPQGGQVPSGAIVGGKTSKGENLYIGRASHAGSNTVGKVHQSHGVFYIPYGFKEHSYKNYEVLVLRR